MKNNIGFIAVGQAGGNIGKQFEKKGYNVFYINTSNEDLETLRSSKFKHHIKGGEGCNKDRLKAKNLLYDDHKKVLSEIQSKLVETVLFVIFGAGGGTGSGAAPVLIELLTRTSNKIIGGVCILPATDEPVRAQINAYECCKELETIEKLGNMYFIDNDGRNKMEINGMFVSLFDKMIAMHTYHNTKGNIDKAEMKELLSTRGNALILSMSREKSNSANIFECLKNNIFAPIENDKVVKYIGLSTVAEISNEDLKKEIGIYADIYRGYCPEHTAMIIVGLTFPYTRINEIKELVEANKQAIQLNLEKVFQTQLLDDIDFLSNQEKNDSKPTDVDEIFSKFYKL